MLDFVIQKILSKKWLILSLLIGNLLLIGIISANPIYLEAVLQRTLDTNLSEYLETENEYPGTIEVSTYVVKGASSQLETVAYIQENLSSFGSEFNVEQSNYIEEFEIEDMRLNLGNDDGKVSYVSVSFLSNLDEHSSIILGEMYTGELEEDGSIPVIVTESTMVNQNLLVGETYIIENLEDKDGNICSVTIKGVFENSSDSDMYWTSSPSEYNQTLFVDQELFLSLFYDASSSETVNTYFTLQLDYTTMKSEDVEDMLLAVNTFENTVSNFSYTKISDNYADILEDYLQEENKLSVTLLILQVPILILLAIFIYMVSKQILALEESEIAIFKSRGASKAQIITIYLMQSGMISFVSLIIGIPLGYLICQVLGASNSFLEFVNRASLSASINAQAIIYALIAALVSIITMVVPVFKYADLGIVLAKRKKQQKFNLKWWEKIGLDIICIAVAIYGLYSVNNQKDFLAQQIALGEDVDPIIFLYSAIFIIGTGLLALRIFPWLIKLIFIIGKKKWTPAIYVSFKKVMDGSHNQGFIMIFLIMTISLGIFSAVTARTINSNEENNISYNIGADIVLQEVWADNSMAVSLDTTDSLVLTYTEPNYEKYSEIEGVESYTKVLINDNISIKTDSGTLQNVTLMGIETKSFGETAYFDEDLLYYHWYEYLNAISQNSEAILMSKNAQEEGGFEIGDTVTYYDSTLKQYVRGTIYAFIDYWPTYNSTSLGTSGDGTVTELNHYLIVANLSQIQAKTGITPYEVWLKVDGSTQPVYDYAEENNMQFVKFDDTQAQIIEQKNDPIFQGTNGILTVGFIAILMLCTVGFLIYWILSIVSRQLQFGIFRAMGMSMKEIILMLVNEQIFVSGYSIIIGAVVGIISSYLFVPLVGLTYTTSEQAIPLEIVYSAGDYAKIFIVVALMISICMTILSVMISKLKITQVLKLGED